MALKNLIINLLFFSQLVANISPSLIALPVDATSKIDSVTVDKILNATVQINMYVMTNRENFSNIQPSIEEFQALVTQGVGHYRCEGLGTLVDVNGQTVILTHNHWGEMLRKADLVEILDAKGHHLRSMINQDFRSLMIFADHGTMVLKAPDGLGLTPVELGNSPVTSGQELILARQQPNIENQVGLVLAKVENSITFKNQAAWELQTLNGSHIVPGDSGGGVWMNGQIVGNNWAVELVTRTELWGNKNGEKVPNGTVYVAQFPFDAQSQLEENLTVAGLVDLAAEDVNNPFERDQE